MVLERSTDWGVQRSNPGEEEIFQNGPDRPRDPPGLLYKGHRISFPGVKRLGCEVNHPPVLDGLTLEHETDSSPETSVSKHLTSRYNPEGGRIYFNRGGSVGSRKSELFMAYSRAKFTFKLAFKKINHLAQIQF